MRQAKPSDAPVVAQLLRQVAETGVSFAAPDEVDEARIANDLAEGIGLRIVAERQNEVVGYLKLDPGRYESVARTARPAASRATTTRSNTPVTQAPSSTISKVRSRQTSACAAPAGRVQIGASVGARTQASASAGVSLRCRQARVIIMGRLSL